MAARVNATRMELSRIKKRLKTAVRGHKLLKDKQDEMVRRFLVYIRRNKELREEMETSLAHAMGKFSMAQAKMGSESVAEALLIPVREAAVTISKRNIMSVNVPAIEYAGGGVSELPYGFAFTSGELDGAVTSLASYLPKLFELAEVEKTCNMLADEIEKTRRRVNALEHVMIPGMRDTVRYISMKLQENERSTQVRLMKVKDMYIEGR